MDDKIIQKFREKFLEEAHLLLESLEKDVLQSETQPNNRNLHESAFRSMHTLKGISAMYGFKYVSDCTHLLESIFQNIRDGKSLLSKEISEISLNSIDHIRQLLADETLSDNALRQRHQLLMSQIEQLANTSLPSEQQQPEATLAITTLTTTRSYYIILNTTEQMYFRGISLGNIYSELASLGKCSIQKIPVLNDEGSDSWGLLLVTSSPMDDIMDAIMFIEDNCCVIKVADFDILNPSNNTAQPIEQSILDLIENKNFAPITIPEDKQQNTEKKSVVPVQSKRISVDTHKLDDLMHLVSQLITLHTQLYDATQNQNQELQFDYLEDLDNLSKQFRNNALEIRLVPLNDVALRFQRLVRDLSKTMGKQIEFITEGTENELDKNTIDGITEPIMHIIRNSIDHGIEMPDIRKQAGKPETGTIRLSASYVSNHTIIKISDDGKGIDLERIKTKAIEKGILTVSDRPTDSELLDIIFLPGFSTAQNLTEVSGRGVGMDIVKKRITDLRGSVSVETKKGEGTTFIIKISQSMTITDTLLFQVGQDYFISPLADIVMCDQIEEENWKQTIRKATLPYNDELIPVVDLRKTLTIDGDYNTHARYLVLNTAQKQIAILADSIIGEHQAVLKPLEGTYGKNFFISSVSQLGNGKLAFYIDGNEVYDYLYKRNIR